VAEFGEGRRRSSGVEVEVATERGGLIVDRVDDHGSCSELAAAAHTPAQRVHEQVAAERLALACAVKRHPREQHDRQFWRVCRTATEQHSVDSTGRRNAR
jgi:hypothetical protein